ncbi:putative mRNA capping enzyme, beta chain [Monocercomonoides exilis]|uniref:putative mRNA capping enzyme, beta chain n=1 Tax=Monocercomonoides exilis TaxID=2049356 RepID=UPI00355A8078|nr:putative mRNA capping enzyme, beta chain [Monocercomonoides exilis]|eukprot:MONOS_3603.1-p1 / transcript=MONOS_3603.1 / gene=MONOS_3603 / organism=Monocercomonoides_exilis_PA203 / gene_product=unspecified product / transcript_product=unspecified product / location=Mono_scaffold00086:52604-53804(+) / protein_length=275 / sequence_SO=supercontig / SO=protein_coding / is_pseudo=false
MAKQFRLFPVSQSAILSEEMPISSSLEHLMMFFGSYLDKDKEDASLEIEARIGTIVSRETQQRVSLPITTEAIISKSYPSNFLSTLTEGQFKNIVYFLSSKIPSENHVKSVTRDMIHRGGRITLSNDDNPQTLACISKDNKNNIDMTCHALPFDIRFSAAFEVEKDPNIVITTPIEYERGKIRDSFFLPNMRIDATQTHHRCLSKFRDWETTEVLPTDLPEFEQSFEIEIEITPMSELKKEYALFKNKQPNKYESIISSFVSNAKILASLRQPKI